MCRTPVGKNTLPEDMSVLLTPMTHHLNVIDSPFQQNIYNFTHCICLVSVWCLERNASPDISRLVHGLEVCGEVLRSCS